MAAFATVSDLAAYLDETIADDDATAALMIELASASIQAYTRQTLEAVTDDEITLPATGSNLLLLPELPVTGVSSVEIDGAPLDVAGYEWLPSGMLKRAGLAAWGKPVVVTYSHGYETIPDAIRAVCLQAAGRSFANPGVILSESVGNYSVTYARSVGVELTESEKLVLDGFRHRRLA